MKKTVTIEIDEREVIEGLNSLDLVSIFMNQVTKIPDEDLVLLCNVVGAEKYQRFIKATKDFAQRLNPRRCMARYDSQWYEKRYRQQQAEVKQLQFAAACRQISWVRWKDVQEEMGALHEHIKEQKEEIERGVNRMKYLEGKITRLQALLAETRTFYNKMKKLLLKEEEQ